MNEKIISALIGLCGACSNNGKTENTDAIVAKALQNCFGETNEDAIAAEIHSEKFTISPNCATCPTPCGNTSDYDMEKIHAQKELKNIKTELLQEAITLTEKISVSGKTELPEEIYLAISYFGYELMEDSYRNLIQTLKQMEV